MTSALNPRQTEALYPDLNSVLKDLEIPEPTLLPSGLLQLGLPAEQLAADTAALVQHHGGQLLTLLASDQRPENKHFWLHAPIYFPAYRQTLILESCLPVGGEMLYRAKNWVKQIDDENEERKRTVNAINVMGRF